MRETHGQNSFTISEVAADCHELIIPQRTMRPSIAHVSKHLDPRFVASRHTTAPVSHIRPLSWNDLYIGTNRIHGKKCMISRQNF